MSIGGGKQRRKFAQTEKILTDVQMSNESVLDFDFSVFGFEYFGLFRIWSFGFDSGLIGAAK